MFDDGCVLLAKAVLERAYIDANCKENSFIRDTARSFLTGRNKAWKMSLEKWCDMACVDYNTVLKEARKKWQIPKT